MILTIQSKSNAQTIVDLFNAIVAGEESEHQAQPLSIYDEHKHICSLVAPDGTQILELIIEREGEEAKAWPRSKTKNKGK